MLYFTLFVPSELKNQPKIVQLSQLFGFKHDLFYEKKYFPF